MAAKRYTAVSTGLLSMRKPGECMYLTMSEDPLGPGGSTLRRGGAPHERMGRGVFFEGLPEGRGRLFLATHLNLWGLRKEGIVPHRRLLSSSPDIG